MVATVHPLATDAALAAFDRGGNAVDAAIAAALMLGVVDGFNSGIGGGCFVLVRTPDGEFHALDGRERAPHAAARDLSCATERPMDSSP
jgi:gamma-glutamyltranspeptidase/glutathione hydrolase